MTEAEWLSSDNSCRMLDFMNCGGFKCGNRHSFARFAIAYCERFFPELIDDRTRAEIADLDRGAFDHEDGFHGSPLISRALISATVGNPKQQKYASQLLRDIFSNRPIRSVPLAPSWLHWNGGTVAKLARTIYDDCCFDDLPILADALEEAGCTETAILEHCLGPGPHVRGCWVVDLLLGKT